MNPFTLFLRAGDQCVDWTASDGLKSSIVAALSLALSGFGLSHSDIGGYTTAKQLGLTRSKVGGVIKLFQIFTYKNKLLLVINYFDYLWLKISLVFILYFKHYCYLCRF